MGRNVGKRCLQRCPWRRPAALWAQWKLCCGQEPGALCPGPAQLSQGEEPGAAPLWVSVGEPRLQESAAWCGPRGRARCRLASCFLCRRRRKTTTKHPCTVSFLGLFQVRYCTTLRTLTGPDIGPWELLPGLEYGAPHLQRHLLSPHLPSGRHPAVMLWKTILPAQLLGSQDPIQVTVNSQGAKSLSLSDLEYQMTSAVSTGMARCYFIEYTL